MTDRDARRERLARVRELMRREGLDAWVVPTADPHQSEYVPTCWRRREWISGFTGSAGTAIVLAERAVLFTDSRYWLQAAQELDDESWELMRSGAASVPAPEDWLASHLEAGEILGADAQVLSLRDEESYRKALEARGVELRLVDENLVDEAWADRPPLPAEAAVPLDVRFSGEAPAAKVARIRERLVEERADALIVSALDAVAWLLDLRGADVDFNPVTIAHALVTRSDVQLFIDPRKLDGRAREHLGDAVTLRPYHGLADALDRVAERGDRVWVEPTTCSAWIARRLEAGGAALLRETSPITALKARKNAAEIAGARACHVRDGVALVRFLRWLEHEVHAGRRVTEVEASDRLLAFRSEGEHFRGASFETISGFGGHGAIVHYRPAEEGDRVIDGSSLYLVDSGGQYLDGTTDVTRTVCFGEPTAEQRDRFTRVLRGHVALARAVFPTGTTGKQLDALARVPLWEVGLDYGHGTGHGVGAYLNVHEGPQGIGPRAPDVALEPGMICSNEPGYYRDGQYGIRIENLVVVVKRADLDADGREFLGFESLTACPIDLGLVDVGALRDEEREWLNEHHAWVREALSDRLDEEGRAWLAHATRRV